MAIVAESPRTQDTAQTAAWRALVDRTFEVHYPRHPLPAGAPPTLAVGRLLHDWICTIAEPIGSNGLQASECSALRQALSRHALNKLELWLTKLTVYEINLARDGNRLQGDSGEQRLGSFLASLDDDDEALALYRRFPVLIGRIIRHFSLLVAFVDQLAEQLVNDRVDLEREFGPLGPLLRAELGQGDAHLGARQVVVLHFEYGSVVFKPRSLSVDQLLGTLVERVNPSLQHRLRAPRCLLRGDYGWQEYVRAGQAEGAEAADRFYYSIGAYIALMHLLNATDVHFENILTTAHGEPVFFDMETAFANNYAPGSPGLTPPAQLAVKAQLEQLGTSVLKSSILPSQRKDAAGMNALTDCDERETTVTVDALVDQNSDRVRLTRQISRVAIKSSLPNVDGRRTRPLLHLERILAGFDDAYACCARARDEVCAWIESQGHCRARSVLRNTSMYGMFLIESTHPVYAESAERLQGLFAKLGIMLEFQPAFRGVLGDEIAQLLQFDIPAFTSRIDEPGVDGFGVRAVSFYGRSPLDTFRETAAQLGERDHRRQRQWITRTLGRTSYPGAVPAATDAVGARLRQCAEFLHDASEHAEEDDTISWLQIMLPEEGGEVMPLTPVLYNGLAGMLVLYAALDADPALANLETRRRRIALTAMLRVFASESAGNGDDGSLFQGGSGVLHALLVDARLHGDAEELDFIASTAARLLAKWQPKHNDVIVGRAGVMLFLCQLLDLRSDETLAAVLAQLAEALLAARDLDTCSWPSDHGVALGGFSHGNSGIAHALLSAGERLQRADFIDVGLQALAFEDQRFDPEQANWPDVREQTAERFNFSWCNGSPGYLIARALHHDRLDPAAQARFAQALRRMLDAPVYVDDSLCHGTAGGLDVLVTLRRHVPTLVAADDVDALAQQLATRDPLRSGSVDCDAPGLMTGLAGIAYALLRSRDPELPSLLSVLG